MEPQNFNHAPVFEQILMGVSIWHGEILLLLDVRFFVFVNSLY